MNKNRLYHGLLLVLFIVFVLIVHKGLQVYQTGDENVYYYMGKLVSEGKIPYKDFFFAHPPLQIYIISFIYKIFGFNIFILKLVPLMSTLTTAFFIFRIVKEKFGDDEAILSAFLYLFAFSIMFNSTISFGILLATMFMMGGLYFFIIRQNYYLAGILFGFAGITRLLTLIPISIIFALVLLKSRKKFIRLSLGFAAVFLVVNLALFILYGQNFIGSVYKFHFLKSHDIRNLSEYITTVKVNWVLFLSLFTLFFLKEKKQMRLFAAVSVTYLVFLMSLKNIFGFYFVPIFPFLAIIGGCGMISIIKKIKSKKYLLIPVVIILAVLIGWDIVSNSLVLHKAVYTRFSRGTDMNEFLLSVSGPGTKLFGEDTVTPLLGLISGIPILNDYVDTNNHVFDTGMRNLNKTLNEVKENDVVFIVNTKGGISNIDAVKNFLNDECGFLTAFKDDTEGGYIFYRC